MMRKIINHPDLMIKKYIYNAFRETEKKKNIFARFQRSQIFGFFFMLRQFLIFMVSKRTRMFALQMKSKVFFIHVLFYHVFIHGILMFRRQTWRFDLQRNVWSENYT